MTVDTFFDDWRDAGQELLRATIAHALRERGAELDNWCEGVEFIDYFDPLLFAQLLGPEPAIDLRQCVFGLLPPDRRPQRLTVRSFADGRVLLPGLGFLTGAPPNAELELVAAAGVPQRLGDSAITLERLPTVTPGARVTVYPHAHPCLRPFLERHGNRLEDVALEAATAQNAAALAAGWALLERAWPRQIAEFERDLRTIVIVEHPRVISMAIAAMHGAIFLNTRGAESPMFFVEELVHQAGHVTFTKIIADWQAFMAIPKTTPMKVLNGNDDDPRSFSDAFHGNYTIARMAQALARLVDVEVELELERELAHELRGRLTLTMVRLELGLRELDHPGLYTDAGLALHRRLEAAWTELDRRLGRLDHRYDVRNQPYVFDARLFAATNPLPQ